MRWLLLFVLATAVGAQSPLTVDEAVAIALRQNPRIAEARKALREAEARLKQARADYYPQIGFSGIAKAGLSGATNGLGLIGLPNSPFYRNFADSVNVYQRLYDFGRTGHNVEQQRQRQEMLEAEVAAAEATVTLGTQRAFYGVLRAERLREAAERTIRSRELMVRQAQAFYEGEIRSRVDLELARFSLSQAQLARIETDHAAGVAQAQLAGAMGSAPGTEYVLQPPDTALPPPQPLAVLVEEAHRNRPELLALRAERGLAAAAVKLARSQRRPFLAFVFSGGYGRFTNVLARQLVAAGTGLVLPLFIGGRLDGQVEEAEAHLDALDSRLENERQQATLETRTAYLRFEKALEIIPVVQAQAQYVREAVRLAQARYRERLGSLVELTQAEAGLAEAEARDVTQFYEAKAAEAELRFAVGRP